MTRILLLIPLFMYTVLSYQFDLKQCGEGKEFACLVRDDCKGDIREENVMREMKFGANNYQNECDVHVLIKRFNISSYFIRIITTATTIKLVQDKNYFGCQLKDGKISALNSESIKIDLVSSEKKEDKEIMCEIVVTYKDSKEAFAERPDQGMSVEYNPFNKDKTARIEETIKIEFHLIPKISGQFETASHQCDPGSIHFDDSKFEKENYHIQPIQPHIEEVRCADKYALAFIFTEGEIKEAQSIKCDQENGKWQYKITNKDNNKIVAPPSFRAVCRRKLCGMCQDPGVTCEGGPDCKFPKFNPDGNCNTYMCADAKNNNGESIVKLNGSKIEIGKFECDGTNDSHAWTFKGKPFSTANCYDEIDCAVYAPVKCPEKKEKCPKVEPSSQQLVCSDGFQLEFDDSSTDSSYKPKIVQCDKKKGTYYFKDEGGETIIVNEKMKVACAKKEEMAASKAGMEPWMWISIGGAIVFALLLLVFVLLCIRRKRKEEEERKSLLKKNDSQPSSATESGNLQGRPRVLVQPPSTAKQISSEQPSENTAKDKTKKVAEKEPKREPTIELHTAYSKDKSKRSDEGPGSAETDLLNEGRRSTTLIQEESAPSAKASQVDSQASKKEKKDDKKPRKFELNDKEKKIAKGVWRKNDDYPTMADIESDWDDEKDGKVSKRRKRTVTRDIPTADTPSARGAKRVELNEKTAEMERLLEDPTIPFKLERVSEEKAPAGNAGTDSQASSRKNNNKFATILTTLDATQEQK